MGAESADFDDLTSPPWGSTLGSRRANKGAAMCVQFAHQCLLHISQLRKSFFVAFQGCLKYDEEALLRCSKADTASQMQEGPPSKARQAKKPVEESSTRRVCINGLEWPTTFLCFSSVCFSRLRKTLLASLRCISGSFEVYNMNLVIPGYFSML